MLINIFLFFFLPIALCSFKMIPVSKIYKGDFFSDYYLYCVESTNGSINLFYTIEDIGFHLVYDKNEEFVSEFKNINKNLIKLEYFSSEKEYLMSFKDFLPFLTYVNENDNIEKDIDGFNNFLILKNKDFILIDHVASLSKLSYYLKLEYYYYPPNFNDKKNKISFSLKDVYIKHYEMIETTETVLFFLLLDNNALSNPLDLYVLDKKTKELNKTQTLHEEVNGFLLINLNSDSDTFIYCISKLGESTKCFLVKYKNKKLISESSVNAFSWTCILTNDFSKFRKNYVLFKDNKIAIICNPSSSIYLTILEYKKNNLNLGDIVDKSIVDDLSYTREISNTFLIYSPNKGLILYYFIMYPRNEYIHAVAKTYIDESCSSFEILANNSTETNITFYDYVTGGINNLNPNFIITEIDPKIILFNNNEIIKPGNTIFYFFIF